MIDFRLSVSTYGWLFLLCLRQGPSSSDMEFLQTGRKSYLHCHFRTGGKVSKQDNYSLRLIKPPFNLASDWYTLELCVCRRISSFSPHVKSQACRVLDYIRRMDGPRCIHSTSLYNWCNAWYLGQTFIRYCSIDHIDKIVS